MSTCREGIQTVDHGPTGVLIPSTTSHPHSDLQQASVFICKLLQLYTYKLANEIPKTSKGNFEMM